MALVYLDMIKLAVPTYVRGRAVEAEAQYLMFGTYDMLYYALPDDQNANCGIDWLGYRHENRHDLDWNYERHPVHVYSLEESKDRLARVLDQEYYSTRPLVLTMVRIAKWPLAMSGIALDVALSSLQKQIDDQVLESDSGAPIVACWNLGNADFLILSRPSRLSKVRDLYLAINAQGLCIDEGGKRVLATKYTSFSSYCAFPKGSGADRRMNKNGIRAWLFSDPGLEFIGFVDSLSNPRAIASRLRANRLLFGERDYQVLVNAGRDMAERVDSVVSIVEEMLDPSTDSMIHSSSLIPSLPVPCQATSGAPPGLKTYNVSWENIDSVRAKVVLPLKSMCAFIRSRVDVFQGLRDGYLEQIDHCINTLDALYKYATRLYAAAYQDDVYYVIANLYEGMGQILEDSLTKMKELCGNERVEELRVIVPRTYVEVMRFVSELQHVYTVLAISPHSHMETYYGSMRSLNATSKLWTSYSGVAKVLCELFPSRDEGQEPTCNVLMVPYREKYSQSSRIFPGSLSTSKLVLIQLNYKTMFDMRLTTFIIAHELGHHTFNVTRKERCRLLLKTIVSYLLTRDFADMLSYPLYTLTHAAKTQGDGKGEKKVEKYAYTRRLMMAKGSGSDVRQWQKLLCLNVLGVLDEDEYSRLYEAMAQDLQKGYLSIVERAANKSAKAFEQDYISVIDKIPECKQYYGSDVIAQMFTFLQKTLDTYYRKAYRRIAKKNTEFLQEIGSYEDEHCLRFDSHQVVKLRTYWQYSQKHYATSAPSDIYIADYCATFLEIFREIHAEVFACMVVKFKLDDYLEYVANFADTDPNLLANRSNLQRIMVVCETTLGDGKCRGLVSWLRSQKCPFDKNMREAAISKIELIGSESHFAYMRKYGAEVTESIKRRICEFDAGQEVELELVRAFAKRGEQSLPHMWDFWLRAMRQAKKAGDAHDQNESAIQ